MLVPTPIAQLFESLVGVALALLRLIKDMVAFFSLSVPAALYRVLHYSLTLQLTFPYLMLLTVGCLAGVIVWLRYRHWNRYEHFREEPIRKQEETYHLLPDGGGDAHEEERGSFHSYLDEFLQAIRVFGFLERPVFHELARHLQTRRLVAGDSLALDEESSFYIVVDGHVQVFAPVPSQTRGISTVGDSDGAPHYQLINEVESGGTLSSLFTILRLFTEDVQLGFTSCPEAHTGSTSEAGTPETDTAPLPQRSSTLQPRQRRRGRSEGPPHVTPSTVLGFRGQHQRSASSMTSSPQLPIGGDEVPAGAAGTPIGASAAHTPVSPALDGAHAPPSPCVGVSSPMSGLPTVSELGSPPTGASDAAEAAPVAPGTVARASVDTTLAVIPANAFRRLTAKFPNAAAHIVQVILTRLARVTFHTAHKYLGLTREVMQTEHSINEHARVYLPSEFYGNSAVEQLRRRFHPAGQSSDAWRSGRQDPVQLPSERAETPLGPGASSISCASSTSGGPSRSGSTSGGMSRTASVSVPPRETASPSVFTPSASMRPDRRAVGPGDLLSLGSGALEEQPAGGVRPSEELLGLRAPIEGPQMLADLRDNVMECISQSIGLTPAVLNERVPPSAAASPFLSSADQQVYRSAYATVFSSLSRPDSVSAATSDESSSMHAAGLSSSTPTGALMSAENEVRIRYFPAGTVLARAGEVNAGLFYVIDGHLDVMLPDDGNHEDQHGPLGADATAASPRPPHEADAFAVPVSDKVGNALDGTKTGRRRQPMHSSTAAYVQQSREQEQSASRVLFTVGRGGIAGYLSSLLGVPSYVDILAKTDVYVGLLPGDALDRLVEKRPNALLTLSKRLLSLLPPLILHIDAALDWQQVNAGQVIFREGDPGDSFYIVINGRLRAITERGRQIEVLAEYGQGDSAGELDVITRSRRTKTLHTIRDSELARMPMTLFNAIALWHPPITIQVSRIIARRMRMEMETRQRTALSLPPHIARISDLGRTTLNFKTVALVPAAASVPVVEFARRLQSAFEETIDGPVAFLHQSTVTRALGRHVFTRMGKLKLAGWLTNQEQAYRLVVYVVDTSVGSSWAQTSIRQADCVLLLGFGDDPSVGEYERLLLSTKTTARKELVLLHADRSVVPGSTRAWLKPRPWISAHHHVEMPGIPASTAPAPADVRPMQALRTLKERLETRIGRTHRRHGGETTRPAHFSDFARLARRLCGLSIGLVLGGGGARGCAHMGVLRALEERGIPVDMVGGTSIGSFVAGLYAREGGVVSSLGRAKRFAGRMASLWRFVADVTYPLVSYTTGHEFNRGIFKCFLNTHIEDMWLPFFCNTTNITWSRMEVHTSGYAWRYVRGSMSLAGLVPPLIDEGNMLVDGGYTDNLPVSVMLSMGARNVFAIDVSSIDDTTPQHYGDTLSGWWVLLNRFNPWSSMRMIPSIPDIQTRLTYTASVKTLEETKALDACLYLRMPVEGYGTLEFGKFDEIFDVGYRSMVDAICDWEAAGRLPLGVELGPRTKQARRRRGGVAARRNSV